MHRTKSKNKVPLIVISAVLLVFILVFSLLGYLKNKEDRAKQEEFEIKIASLSVEKKRLLNEYEQMLKQYNSEAGVSAVIGLLFIDINEELYDIIYPETSFPCTVCISPSSLPGDEGNISVEEYNKLLADGWKTSVFWNGEGDLGEYLDECRDAFTKRGLDMPNSMLFWQNYKSEHDGVIAEYGIVHALHFGGGDYPLFEKEVDTEIWHPGAVAWNDPESQNYLGTLIASGGHYVYCMGFFYGSETDTLRAERRVGFNLSNTPDRFDYSFSNYFAAYKRMIAKFTDNKDLGKLELLTLDEAREHREIYVAKVMENQTKLESERARIYGEIAVIEKQILEIYEEYN